MFAGRVKIVNHSSCRTSAILKYFCPLVSPIYLGNHFDCNEQSVNPNTILTHASLKITIYDIEDIRTQ